MNRASSLVAVALLVATAASCSAAPTADSIDERAASVMPFDLELTTHDYTKTAQGGVQEVVANDPSGSEQVTLIQDHLAEEAVKFSEGDFADPARIHGMDMAGLAELEAGFSRIRVEYSAQSDGGTITYSSDEPELIEAIHSWFDRQIADHG